MKKLFVGLAVIVVLLVVVVVAAPFFIPVDTIRAEVTKAAKEATGRDLAIKGDFNLAILPRFELEANDVTFSNAQWASDEQMATLNKLLIRLQILPLLSGQVKVDSFVLVQPVIHLETDAQGKGNWEMAAAADSGGGSSDSSGSSGAGAGGSVPEISLGEMRLENGLVTFKDGASGETIELSNINMTVDLPSLDDPFAADGALTWNGEELKLRIDGDKARGFMTGEQTGIKIALTSNPVNLAYQGTVATAGPIKAGGTVDLNVPSIRRLAAWAGSPLEVPGNALQLLTIKGKVAVDGQRYAFNEAKIQLDKMNADGDFSADLTGAKPYAKGRLNIDQVDLNDYLPPDTGESASSGDSGGSASGASGGGSSEWSDDPIDLSGLHAANADFDLTVGGILVQALKIGQSAVSTSLKDGLLNVNLTQLQLYEGDGQGSIQVDARGDVPAVKKSFTLAGLQAEPLLTDAAQFGNLSGTAEMKIDVTAKGGSQRVMVENLNGNGAVKFTDGAIKGINLGAMVRNSASAFLDPGANEAQKTDFAELSGTYKITNGNLVNNDLLLLSPLLRLTGAGTADMPLRTLNYRIEPKLVASAEGQGGSTDTEGVTVPVIVEGPWDDLSYRPDLAGLVEGIAKDPGKALEAIQGGGLENLTGGEGGVGDVLKDVTGGGESGGESGGAEEGAKDLIKGLFD